MHFLHFLHFNGVFNFEAPKVAEHLVVTTKLIECVVLINTLSLDESLVHIIHCVMYHLNY